MMVRIVGMDKFKVEAFLQDYRAVCEKHRLFIGGYDDGPFVGEITDQWNPLDEHINFLMSMAF